MSHCWILVKGDNSIVKWFQDFLRCVRKALSLIHLIPPCPELWTTDSKVGWLLLCQLFSGTQVCCEVTTPNCSSAASTVLVRTPIRLSYPAQSCLTFPASTDSSLPVAWITGPATDPSAFLRLYPLNSQNFDDLSIILLHVHTSHELFLNSALSIVNV